MKPAAAFSVGLWTGAAVVAAVGLFYVQSTDRVRGGALPASASELAAKMEQIRVLEQETARLNAEVQRLKETASSLQGSLNAAGRRRVPFLRGNDAGESAPLDAALDQWMEQVVAAAEVGALPQLEETALKNNRRALEALALLADLDQGVALTRVWRSGSLTLPNLVLATRYLAATMEINGSAEALLRGLAADRNADVRVLSAAVDGLANPNFAVSFGSGAPVAAPPHFKPDYAQRLRVLHGLLGMFTDENLRGYAEQAKADLQARWAESGRGE